MQLHLQFVLGFGFAKSNSMGFTHDYSLAPITLTPAQSLPLSSRHLTERVAMMNRPGAMGLSHDYKASTHLHVVIFVKTFDPALRGK